METAAIAAELALSTANERRLGRLAEPLERGRAGRLFQAARWSVRTGLALRLARRRGGPAADHAASALFLLGGLAFRFAWVAAGRASAADDVGVAQTARAGRRDPGTTRGSRTGSPPKR